VGNLTACSSKKLPDISPEFADRPDNAIHQAFETAVPRLHIAVEGGKDGREQHIPFRETHECFFQINPRRKGNE
jgi:hypothetical protein